MEVVSSETRSRLYSGDDESIPSTPRHRAPSTAGGLLGSVDDGDSVSVEDDDDDNAFVDDDNNITGYVNSSVNILPNDSGFLPRPELNQDELRAQEEEVEEEEQHAWANDQMPLLSS